MPLRFDPSSLTAYHVHKRITSKSLCTEGQLCLDFGSQSHALDRRNYLIGDYFELLTAAIFGGKRKSWEPDDDINPDVVNGFHMYESKAVSWNRDLKISQFQLDKYNGAFRDTSYVLWVYTLRNPMKVLGGYDRDRYFSVLGKAVGFCIVLPLNLVNSIVESTNAKYQSVCDWSGGTTRLSPTFLKLMMQNPGGALRECFWIKTSGFRFVKRVLPDGVAIDGYTVKPFPMLIIQNR